MPGTPPSDAGNPPTGNKRSGHTIEPMDFETRAIHAGQEPDPATGAVTTPIYQTSTFAQEAVGVHKGYDYARVANPTRTALEECLASLENAAHGHAFSSGIGATTTIMHLLDPGDHVVCVNDVYGGTYRMFSQVYEPKGYRFTYVTPEQLSSDPASHVAGARLVWIESPTNPLLNLVDIAAVAAAAKAAGALPSSTTRSRPRTCRRARPRRRHRPALDDEVPRRPLRRHRRLRRRRTTRRSPSGCGSCRSRSGPCPGRSTLARAARPEDARGAHGPALRERACRRRLPRGAPAGHTGLWPGLPDHPGHGIARSQMRDFGGMVSFLVETEDEAVELVAHTEVWTLAESLGGVESLIEHPARMTHASTATGPFAAPANLVRLSVGIESATTWSRTSARPSRRRRRAPSARARWTGSAQVQPRLSCPRRA